ncbi:MAG: hypothetical protein VR72_05660 [Clostridiaceae bacterium BRH_c20a]|nr:MAG: hypothetical protein VR72_05660 [Clostridiaceae bacterium BRH_c20a]
MMVKAVIAEVLPNSLAAEIGLEPGDKIIKVNNKPPEDLIHFQYLWADEEIELLVEKQDGEIFFEIEKEYDETLGVVFEQAVFDKIRHCQNKCLFCFIEQMAPAMRPSLYEKDDDYRLSFLQGNFITLTNMKKGDFDRIKEYHLSPLYVSVHTTNPSLRQTILDNPHADKIMEQLKSLVELGIRVHTQVVLCPGINDGEYLERTIDDLSPLWPGIQSLAIVPVGVTNFRKNLERFPSFSKGYAQKLVNMVSEKQSYFRNKIGNSFVYLGDEIYLQAQTYFPPSKHYDDFPQIENGVGVSRIFLDDFFKNKNNLPASIKKQRYIIATSKLGKKVLEPIIFYLKKIEGLEIDIKVIENVFFGSRVTVNGLLTGQDLLEGLKDITPDSQVLISEIMLKKGEGIFLDGLTPEDVGQKLGIKIIVVKNNAQSLINCIISRNF